MYEQLIDLQISCFRTGRSTLSITHSLPLLPSPIRVHIYVSLLNAVTFGGACLSCMLVHTHFRAPHSVLHFVSAHPWCSVECPEGVHTIC